MCKTLVMVSFVHVFSNFRGAQAKYWQWQEHICHLNKASESKVLWIRRPWTNKIICCEMLLRKNVN